VHTGQCALRCHIPYMHYIQAPMCTPYMPYSLYALHTYTWRVCMPYMIDAGAGRACVNVLLLYMCALYDTCLICIVFLIDAGAGRTHGNRCLMSYMPYSLYVCLKCLICHIPCLICHIPYMYALYVLYAIFLVLYAIDVLYAIFLICMPYITLALHVLFV
jgi:hypothetical protein